MANPADSKTPQAAHDSAHDSLRHTSHSIKETIESIVVAFILAFVFRAFVIEAFVIPTGSMAATLLGEHGAMTCSDCGYEYVYGTSNSSSPKCPNCFWQGEPAPYSGRSILSGDRILVLKWPLDIDADRLGPKRWEVTVFKDPSDGVTNYIKRLVGLPNEVLEIIDGDIYTVPVSALDPQTVSDLDEIRHVTFLLGESETHHVKSRHDPDQLRRRRSDLMEKVRPELMSKYQIRRKSDPAQSSLWFNVYNHNYIPQRSRRKERVPHWEPAGPGWSTENRRLTFAGESHAEEQAIVFTPPKPDGRITDFYAYNPNGVSLSSAQEVGDLRLQSVLFFEDGEGFVRFRLTKRDREFQATLHADGQVRLEQHRRASGSAGDSGASASQSWSPLGEGRYRLDPLDPSKPITIDLANVDYRVSLKIDGNTVLASTDEQYAPDLDDLAKNSYYDSPARAEISARQVRFRLAHVVLERDVHYRSAAIRGESRNGRSISNPWPRQDGWGTFENPIYLRAWEYFMLGDNSPASKDSRLWYEIGPHLLNRGEDYQIGTVPKDQLIGKAFFVYWPSGYRLSSRIALGIIPNVGAMRWIR